MSIFKRVYDFIEACRAMSENQTRVDERGGITEYPAAIELRQW